VSKWKVGEQTVARKDVRGDDRGYTSDFRLG